MLALSEAAVGGAVCLLAVLVPGAVLWFIWRFFRSAVKSGTAAALPGVTVTQPPPATPPARVIAGAQFTEADVRRIVREELLAAQEAARARRAGSQASTPPGPSRGPSR